MLQLKVERPSIPLLTKKTLGSKFTKSTYFCTSLKKRFIKDQQPSTMLQHFLSLLLLFTTSPLAAQTKVVLRLDDLTTQEATFCMPVTADSFPDIVAAQFSLVWDPAIVRFSDIEFGSNPLSLQPGNIFSPNDSTLGVSWVASDLVGITLAPGTTLLSFCFTAQVSAGSTPLSFDGYLPGEFIQTNSSMAFPAQLLDGSITLEEPSSIRAANWPQAITLFPNPNQGYYLEISGLPEGLSAISLHDNSGRLLQEASVATSRIAIAHLPNGIYWLLIRKGKEVSRQAFAIQR